MRFFPLLKTKTFQIAIRLGVNNKIIIYLFIYWFINWLVYYHDCKVHIFTHNENSGHLQITKALNSDKRSIFNKRNLIVI